MSNPAIHQLEALLPLACEWAEAQERMILQSGVPLTAEMLATARKIGVTQPERVRLLRIAELPKPEHPELRAAGQAFGLFSKSAAGLALRYGIAIRADCWESRQMLIHELAHTMQFERLGGIESFLRQYMEELVTVGYACSPLEEEANRIAQEACATIDDLRGWFTTPLRRDARLHTRPEWDAEFSQGDKCADVFIGIIRHDDSVEVVAARNCDNDRSKDHQHYWRDVWHKRWRWTKASGLFALWNEFSVEERDRIEQAIQRKVDSLLTGGEGEPHPYQGYSNLPWQNSGASRAGVSCTGLVWLWIKEQTGFHPPPPTLPAGTVMESRNMPVFKQSNFEKGDVVFFRHKATGKITHAAVCVAENKYLHILQGVESRVENGFKIFERLGFTVIGALSPIQAQAFYQAIAAEHQEKQAASAGSPVCAV